MKWIKASERLPDKSGLHHCRFLYDGKPFRPLLLSKEELAQCRERTDNVEIEWLSESESPLSKKEDEVADLSEQVSEGIRLSVDNLAMAHYWKQRCEELFGVLKVVFYATVKSEENPIVEWEKFLERNNYKDLWQSIKQSLPKQEDKITRLEIINHATNDKPIGRLLTLYKETNDFKSLEFSYQDGGRTLKIFLD